MRNFNYKFREDEGIYQIKVDDSYILRVCDITRFYNFSSFYDIVDSIHCHYGKCLARQDDEITFERKNDVNNFIDNFLVPYEIAFNLSSNIK